MEVIGAVRAGDEEATDDLLASIVLAYTETAVLIDRLLRAVNAPRK